MVLGGIGLLIVGGYRLLVESEWGYTSGIAGWSSLVAVVLIAVVTVQHFRK